ncbi:hypothetical protein CHS0354_001241 [Potamilus streckersoni]|uniref:RZ-type domain-containing protein n=1 Tax=Potamilus streckersoni TaxID=2493646 RepID=A0AAE0S3G3_9BIVA|nr:hypothetical protein CHS0354_001241 [Potamilus streckersoni]
MDPNMIPSQLARGIHWNTFEDTETDQREIKGRERHNERLQQKVQKEFVRNQEGHMKLFKNKKTDQMKFKNRRRYVEQCKYPDVDRSESAQSLPTETVGYLLMDEHKFQELETQSDQHEHPVIDTFKKRRESHKRQFEKQKCEVNQFRDHEKVIDQLIEPEFKKYESATAGQLEQPKSHETKFEFKESEGSNETLEIEIPGRRQELSVTDQLRSLDRSSNQIYHGKHFKVKAKKNEHDNKAKAVVHERDRGEKKVNLGNPEIDRYNFRQQDGLSGRLKQMEMEGPNDDRESHKGTYRRLEITSRLSGTRNMLRDPFKNQEVNKDVDAQEKHQSQIQNQDKEQQEFSDTEGQRDQYKQINQQRPAIKQGSPRHFFKTLHHYRDSDQHKQSVIDWSDSYKEKHLSQFKNSKMMVRRQCKDGEKHNDGHNKSKNDRTESGVVNNTSRYKNHEIDRHRFKNSEKQDDQTEHPKMKRPKTEREREKIRFGIKGDRARNNQEYERPVLRQIEREQRRRGDQSGNQDTDQHSLIIHDKHRNYETDNAKRSQGRYWGRHENTVTDHYDFSSQNRHEDPLKDLQMNRKFVETRHQGETYGKIWQHRNSQDTERSGAIPRRGGRARSWGRDDNWHGRDSPVRVREKGYCRDGVVGNALKFLEVDHNGKAKLSELINREPSEIVQVLATRVNNGSIEAYLHECSNDQKCLKDFLRVLSKACQCHSMDASLRLILNAVRQDSFTNSVVGYITFVLLEVTKGNVEEHIQLIKDVIRIVRETCLRMPSASLMLCIGIHTAIQTVVDAMINSTDAKDDSLLDEFMILTECKNDLLKSDHFKHKGQNQVPLKECDPEDDFREYKVFPQSLELDSHVRPFLRKNKSTGQYKDTDHYLDVQYRLLREDFIGPLRDGIAEFQRAMRDEGKTRRLQSIRIYQHVRIVAPVCSNSGVSSLIQFDVSHMRVRWESSKRLLFGSLVCLSADSFETFYFATVTERDPTCLEKGLLHVKFEHDHDTVKKLLTMEFTMAETSAYFEAYRHVLSGLQKIYTGDLPFERYIVRCETDVQPPLYLRQTFKTNIELRPLVDETFVIREQSRLRKEGTTRTDGIDSFSDESRPARNVRVLDRSSWPPAELLHLNQSQHDAVISALTKEFVIIQGPPGTGKTYIGLKIVKALLYNRYLWSKNPNDGSRDPRPMLVVCYTNHALDQFLEGIKKFYEGDVVRVGSQSSSDVMNKYSIRNFRACNVNEVVHENKQKAEMTFNELKKKFNVITEMVIDTQTNIIHEKFLSPFMDQACTQLTKGFRELYCKDPEVTKRLGNKSSVIVEWLGLGKVAPEIEIGDERDGEGDQNSREITNGGSQNIDREEIPVNRENVQAKLELNRKYENKNDNGDLIGIENEVDTIQKERMLDIDDHRETFHFIFSSNKNGVALHVEQIDYIPEGKDSSLLKQQQDHKRIIKKHVQQQLLCTDVMSKDEADRLQNLWTMTQKDKWRLYRRWIFLYKEYLMEKLNFEEVDQAAERLKEAIMQEDKEILRNATVIGMTTTGAARYQSILQEIRPRIIVVEEAAEVLEAHVVTTLSSGCEHLILIGDHKQLKPNPTVFKLARDYNLDLSLFERMIKNDMSWNCLHMQHRMRPEIADLIRHIYPDLRDHESVQNAEVIKGVSSSICFINHTYPEQNEEDVKSHSNKHEAEFTVAFCQYLLQQGYGPSQITVLTLYSGQLFCLKKRMPAEAFKGVRLTLVDNYQGEENDIVILSLVRSNKEGQIGFVGIENRICVALSRAKKGLYVIGNFDLLSNRSELWNKIVKTMNKKCLMGPGIKLYCQNHPRDKGFMATVSKDFSNAPEGGCSKNCEYRLNCGHVCPKPCHVYDPGHKNVKCHKTCGKIRCANNHECKKLCYMDCGKCMEPVPKIIPVCGHEQQVPCYLRPSEFSCRDPCELILSCGHTCQEMCGDEHTSECLTVVEKTWDCGHTEKVSCHIKSCRQPCAEILKCEHMCQGTCGDCLDGRLHRECRNECSRVLICGHLCRDMCNNCPPCAQKCENRCSHSNCMKLCGEECVPCRESCEWRCEHYQCGKLCYEPCDRPRCNRPCQKMLSCNHACIGLCGEPCPYLCRDCNRDEITQIFFGSEDNPDARFVQLEDCKHIFEVKGLDKWIDASDEHNEGDTIQLKVCPMCTTPIRRNLRYSNVIKSTLNDIERVKAVVRGDERKIEEQKLKIRSRLTTHFRRSSHRAQGRLLEKLEKLLASATSENELIAFDNQIELLVYSLKLKQRFEKEYYSTSNHEKSNALHDLQKFQDWVRIRRTVLTDQEIDDAQQELARLAAYLNLIKVSKKIRDRKAVLDEEIQELKKSAEKIVADRKKFTKDREALVEKCLQQLKNICPLSGLGFNEEELGSIIKAMGFTKGHWFKCKNGHIYAIGECGGATEEAQCPDCDSIIGGKNHALRADNAVAKEMDGAIMSAYDEAANMNYVMLYDLLGNDF